MNEQLKSALRISLSVNILFEKLSNKRAGGSVHEKKKLVLSPQALLNQLRAVFDRSPLLSETPPAPTPGAPGPRTPELRQSQALLIRRG